MTEEWLNYDDSRVKVYGSYDGVDPQSGALQFIFRSHVKTLTTLPSNVISEDLNLAAANDNEALREAA